MEIQNPNNRPPEESALPKEIQLPQEAVVPLGIWMENTFSDDLANIQKETSSLFPEQSMPAEDMRHAYNQMKNLINAFKGNNKVTMINQGGFYGFPRDFPANADEEPQDVIVSPDVLQEGTIIITSEIANGLRDAFLLDRLSNRVTTIFISHPDLQPADEPNDERREALRQFVEIGQKIHDKGNEFLGSHGSSLKITIDAQKHVTVEPLTPEAAEEQ